MTIVVSIVCETVHSCRIDSKLQIKPILYREHFVIQRFSPDLLHNILVRLEEHRHGSREIDDPLLILNLSGKSIKVKIGLIT